MWLTFVSFLIQFLQLKMSEGLLDSFRQFGLGAPRGGFSRSGRTLRWGDSYLERIVSSIRQARFRGPTVSGLSRGSISSVVSYLKSPASNVASPFVSSPGSTLSSGLSTPINWLSPSAEIGRNPVGRPIGWRPAYANQVPLFTRLSGAFSGFGRVAGSLGARIAAGVASLGPLGLAVAAAAVVAVAIGATIYFVRKGQDSTIVDQVDKTIDFVDPDYDPDEKLSIDPINIHPIVEDVDSWIGNVPWQRRPGRDKTLREVWQASKVLQSSFADFCLKNPKTF